MLVMFNWLSGYMDGEIKIESTIIKSKVKGVLTGLIVILFIEKLSING
jgi:hypothetical protein